jgi:manganese oxidase
MSRPRVLTYSSPSLQSALCVAVALIGLSILLLPGRDSRAHIPARGWLVSLTERSIALPRVEPNRNTMPAGVLRHDTLRLHLDVQRGVWHPDGPSGDSVEVAAFVEPGRPLQTPGPLLRVPLGTVAIVTVHNSLATALIVHGFGESRGVASGSAPLTPDGSHTFVFRATTVGTFYYAATIGRTPVVARHLDDSQLHGAIVVDPPGYRPDAHDRVFMLSWWYESDTTSHTGLRRAGMAINGRSWPQTERISVAQGDSLRWRWINLTLIDHPMHLHGFYFRVDGRGDGARFERASGADGRLAVTENMPAGSTMEMAWSPDRAGNWLMHCHMATHMSHLASLSTRHPLATERRHAPHRTTPQDVMHHAMGGLVLGIHVTPRGSVAARTRRARPLTLEISDHDAAHDRHPTMRASLREAGATRDHGTAGGPGATLVLRKDEPVAITIVNRAHAPTAIHWHGIELESPADGVPGWSGAKAVTVPAIAPGDSHTVRFTPTRAGTFMYHSHFNEPEQIASGLFGAILVLPAPATRDDETDRVLIWSDDGPTANLIAGPYPPPLLNGDRTPSPVSLAFGRRYRLRLINIRTDYSMLLSLVDPSGAPARWTVIAKDGADIPMTQQRETVAELRFAPGEIYDVLFTPRQADTYSLSYRRGDQSPVPNPTNVLELVVH